MFDVDDIRDWRGLPWTTRTAASQQAGGRLLRHRHQETTFATVKVGLPGGGRLVFVPIDGARVSPQSVRVMTDKKTAKDAPSIGTDGELEAAGEPAIYAHYEGSDYVLGANGERRLGRR